MLHSCNTPYTPNPLTAIAYHQVAMMQAAAELPAFALRNLLDGYTQAAGAAANLLQSALVPPALFMPPPSMMMGPMAPIAGCGYASQQNVDLAPFAPNDFLSRAFNPERREAARMEHVLRSDPFARASFEQAIGGRIVDFGCANDGRFTVERYPQAMPFSPCLGNPMAQSIAGVYQQMGLGVLSAVGTLGGAAIGGVGGALLGGLGGQALGGLGGTVAGGLGGAAVGSLFGPGGTLLGGVAGAVAGNLGGQVLGRVGGTVVGGAVGAELGGAIGGSLLGNPFAFNPFLALTLGGVSNVANQLLGFSSFGGGVQGMPPLFGQGAASWNPLAQPGKISGSNQAYEGAHSGQVHSVLQDPSLTMEDKVMLALMLVCQKMDDDIKRQTEYLNNLQNQQGARNKAGGALGLVGGVAGTAIGGPIGAKVGAGLGSKVGGAVKEDGEKSIDLETKKLERMITKRSQLFDTLGKIMERYDQSAKNVIQSMRG